MLLKGKLKIPENIMHRFSDQPKPTEKKNKKKDDGDVRDEKEEELRTFQAGLRGEGEGRSEAETWHDDDEGNQPSPERCAPRRVHGAMVKIDDNNVSVEKRSELEFELSQKVINLDALRSIACCGHLAGEFRSIVWKLLLGYIPAEKDLWKEELAKNRLRYAELKRELLINPSEISAEDEFVNTTKCQENDADGLLCRRAISNGDHPLCLGNGSIWNQYFKDAEIVEQIDRDLHRTHQDLFFFSGNSSFGKKNHEAMKNILLLFAKLNPAIGYVQGMNEVLAPIYYLFSMTPDGEDDSEAEADSFQCFVRLLSGSVDHFCQQLDNSSVGIHSTLSHFSELIKANDEELWRYLDSSKVVKSIMDVLRVKPSDNFRSGLIMTTMNPQFYAFRWITLLLTQEFELSSIMRIWDCLLSNPAGVQDMLLRVCCAMLLCIRGDLLGGDFISNLKLLQHYPEVDLEHLLDIAHHLRPAPSYQLFGSIS